MKADDPMAGRPSKRDHLPNPNSEFPMDDHPALHTLPALLALPSCINIPDSPPGGTSATRAFVFAVGFGMTLAVALGTGSAKAQSGPCLAASEAFDSLQGRRSFGVRVEAGGAHYPKENWANGARVEASTAWRILTAGAGHEGHGGQGRQRGQGGGYAREWRGGVGRAGDGSVGVEVAAQWALHLGSPLDERELREVEIRYADGNRWVPCAGLRYGHDGLGRVTSITETWDEGPDRVEYGLQYGYDEGGGLASIVQTARLDGLEVPVFESTFGYDAQGRLATFEEVEYDLSGQAPFTRVAFEFSHSADGSTSEGLAVRDGYEGTPNADTSFVQVVAGEPLVLMGYESALIPIGGAPYRYRNLWRESFPTLSSLNGFFLTYTLWYPFVPRVYEYWDPSHEEWVLYDRIRYELDGRTLWVRSEMWDRVERVWMPWRDFGMRLDGEGAPEVIDNIERYWGEPRWVERHLLNGAMGVSMEPRIGEGGDRGRRPVPRLLPNTPNPFNPVTTLRYEMPDAGRVRLDVFNVLGDRLTRLDQGLREAGVHQVEFNAAGWPSGVYICRLETGRGSDTLRMLLVK